MRTSFIQIILIYLVFPWLRNSDFNTYIVRNQWNYITWFRKLMACQISLLNVNQICLLYRKLINAYSKTAIYLLM